MRSLRVLRQSTKFKAHSTKHEVQRPKSKDLSPKTQDHFHSRTYSNSNGLPLIPVAGGAIQLAILPGSVTGCIRLRTYSRSATLGNHSSLRFSNSASEINFPSRSKL